MLAFYFILIGMYLFYTRSKYFPAFLFRPNIPMVKSWGTVFLVIGTGIYVHSDGWAGGLLLAFVAFSLAMCLTQFFATLGRKYFYGMAVIIHLFLLIELISYAS